MVCLDTTFLIDLLRKKPIAEKKLRSLMKATEGPCTTVITLAELFYGAYKSKNVELEKENIKQALCGMLVLDMNETAAEKFGQIYSSIEKRGQVISDRDVMIASIALANGEHIIVTRNRKDFERIPNLTIEMY
jgi:tRNA(fMet)-specific endonuclease VapC